MQVNETLIGVKRRYHIDRCVANGTVADTYSAFSRRQSGRGLRRRYYALLAFPQSCSDTELQDAVDNALAMLPYHAHIEEEIQHDGRRIVVIARGTERPQRTSHGNTLLNKGYLMLLLSALLLILLIIRFYQTSGSSDTESFTPVETTVAE